MKGIVISRSGNGRSYEVELADGYIMRRNRRHIKVDFSDGGTEEDEGVNDDEAEKNPRRSARIAEKAQVDLLHTRFGPVDSGSSESEQISSPILPWAVPTPPSPPPPRQSNRTYLMALTSSTSAASTCPQQASASHSSCALASPSPSSAGWVSASPVANQRAAKCCPSPYQCNNSPPRPCQSNPCSLSNPRSLTRSSPSWTDSKGKEGASATMSDEGGTTSDSMLSRMKPLHSEEEEKQAAPQQQPHPLGARPRQPRQYRST